MKELMREKLDKMDDLKQRKMLKNIVGEVLDALIDHQKEFNKSLEQRVFDEIADQENNYDIYTTIVKKERVDLLDEFLFPIIEDDREIESYDKQELIEKIKKGEQVAVTKIFVNLDYQQLEDLKKSSKIYTATIISEEQEYPVTVELHYNEEYIKKEEELYNLFLENAIPWRTINNPYIRRFFDVVIVDANVSLDELTDFEEIKFDFGDLEHNKYINYIPVWNIQRVGQKGEGFPLPAEDKINYEHVISLDTLGVNNGYLVIPDNFNIISFQQCVDELRITTNKSSAASWNILKIIQNEKYKNEKFEFELMKNTRANTFMNKFLQRQNSNIKSLAELNRLIKSFQLKSQFKLEDIEIIDSVENTDKYLSYDLNFFIRDQIRINNDRKVMLLKLSGGETNDFKYDLLSFIVSEIQLYFPDYICKGVIN